MNHPTNKQFTDLRSRMGLLDILSVGSSGLRTRRVRAALSVLGITIGVAALVGILGLSQSGSADLLKDLDALGTNLLTVQAGDGFRSQQASLEVHGKKFNLKNNPFYEDIIVNNYETKGLEFQKFLIQNNLSSNMWVIAQKKNS